MFVLQATTVQCNSSIENSVTNSVTAKKEPLKKYIYIYKKCYVGNKFFYFIFEFLELGK